MAYVAIRTKFIGPTNHRPDRIKATAMESYSDGRRKSVTITYDYGIPTATQHRQAAEALLPLLNIGEDVELIEGGWERGYIYIPVSKEQR
jgi:hypothetical protein